MEHETFGEWLFGEIQRRGTTVSDLAAKIRVKPSTVSRWVNNTRTPDPEYCVRIAHGLQLDPDVVLDKAGHRPLQDDELLSRIPPEVRFYFMNFSKLPPDRQRLLLRQLEAYYEEIGVEMPGLETEKER